MHIHESTRAVGFLVAAAMMFLLLAAVPTCAQTDFSRLPIEAGDMAWVTEPSGETFGGIVAAISATTLSIGGRKVHPEPGLKIARAGDPLWNGLLIGAAFGVLSGTTIAAEACLNSPRWHCAVGGAIGFGALGAFIDWRRQGRTIVFNAPPAAAPGARLVPSIGADRKTLSLVLTF